MPSSGTCAQELCERPGHLWDIFASKKLPQKAFFGEKKKEAAALA
jgi:hypothetical protein